MTTQLVGHEFQAVGEGFLTGERLESRGRWLRERADAQLRHALAADNVYDKDERIGIALILYEQAAKAAGL